MLINTGAIVLKNFKYADHSLICKVYTEQAGIKSYLVSNPHSRKSAFRPALFQPLSLINLVAYNKDNKQLQHLREVACSEPLKTTHTSPVKSSIALFVAEMLLKTIREEEANPPLYAFIKHFIQKLDNETGSCANFHLVFLLHLTQYLGFYPKILTYSEGAYFDMPEGAFTESRPIHSYLVEPHLAKFLHMLLASETYNSNTATLNGQTRSALLDIIIRYYQMHLEGIGKIHSASILQMVFE